MVETDQPESVESDKVFHTVAAQARGYGVESLIERGFTGKGQTVVDIVSFGCPTLQQDMDIFDRQFGLPPITVKIIA
jgi:subtilase family serine protease